MKKIVMILLVILSLSLIGCKKNELIGIDRIKDKGSLVVGFTDYPPYGYIEDGEYLGFDLEVAKLVCKELGVKFEAKYIDWDTKDSEIKTNVDCIWNAFTITEELKSAIEFSKPYWETNLVAVVSKDSTLSSVDELKGLTIAVEASSTADLSLSGNSDYKLEKYTKVSDGLLAVKASQADALVADATYAESQIAKYSSDYKILSGTIGEVEEYGIGFRKNEKDLCDEVDKIIDKLYQEGKLDNLLAKYFGESNGFKR